MMITRIGDRIMTIYVLDPTSNQNDLVPWYDVHKSPFTPIDIGDPVSIEYKRIHIASKKSARRRLMATDVLVASHVRNVVSRDRALESVVFYDERAVLDPSYAAGPFDVSEYGHPVCYYTPGYEGSNITITTKVYEVRRAATTCIANVTSALKSAVGILGSVAATTNPLLSMATPVATGLIGAGGAVLASSIDPKHLMTREPYTINFEYASTSNELFVAGTYVVIFDDDDDDDDDTQHYSASFRPGDYILRQSRLIQKSTLISASNMTPDAPMNVEYPGSYFVLKIDTKARPELRDFDFTASCHDLLSKVNDAPMALTEEIVNVKRDSYHLLLMGAITAANKRNPKLQQALMQQLQASDPIQAEWLQTNVLLNKSF